MFFHIGKYILENNKIRNPLDLNNGIYKFSNILVKEVRMIF